MDNSALNKAHQQHRRADNHLRFRRYAEAIECHKNAVELLTEALKCTENPRSLESIKLQIDFHARQKNIINIKKEQYEQYKIALQNKFSDASDLSFDDKEGNMLTVAIYQTIEESDSLIELIQKTREHSDTDSTKSGVTDTDNTDDIDGTSNNISGLKHPKDDKTVIEEIKILNKQLHLLVSQLVNQLDNSKRENELLKHKLKQFESEKAQNNKNHSNILKVATDSSGATSPYVCSPCSEFSPDVQDTNLLPVLAPLAIPKFDFNSQNGSVNNFRMNFNDTNNSNS